MGFPFLPNFNGPLLNLIARILSSLSRCRASHPKSRSGPGGYVPSSELELAGLGGAGATSPLDNLSQDSLYFLGSNGGGGGKALFRVLRSALRASSRCLQVGPPEERVELLEFELPGRDNASFVMACAPRTTLVLFCNASLATCAAAHEAVLCIFVGNASRTIGAGLGLPCPTSLSESDCGGVVDMPDISSFS